VRAIGHHAVWIHAGERGNSTSVIEYFNQHPPVIWFADGSGLEGNEYVELTNLRPPYDRTKIETWDWTGTDIRRESQGLLRDAATVQARVIREMQTRDYAVIFDDDGKGEIADVVGIRLVGDAASPTRIEVDLFHCKYSHGDAPGHRLKDLYEVCGQAQKSVSWMVTAEKPTDIFTHLLRRDALRVDAEEPTRLEKGDTDLVETILEMSRIRPVELRIFIVQPGVSVQEVSDDQLRLLSVTETYLHETYQIHFGVIVSP
jgi:hypothetical protein